MAAFIAKQMVGNKLSSVKGALGGGGDDEKDEEKKEGEEGGEGDPEVLAAMEEAEEKRKEKHRKMEEERETMRQGIRDKYGLKKKVEEGPPMEDPASAGRVGRQKKTPEQLAAEANADSDDEQNSFFPSSLDELTSKVGELPGKVATSVSEAKENPPCSPGVETMAAAVMDVAEGPKYTAKKLHSCS
ncbi:hypothetical protein LSAT2_002195 [Lamellibrachia satsuma]|nr:hypothetical protein LSAT2_002195 [Lamellibrachia satsuma]